MPLKQKKTTRINQLRPQYSVGLVIIIFLFLLSVVLQLISTQLIYGFQYRAAAKEFRMRATKDSIVYAKRGEIFDSSGTYVFATNINKYIVSSDPKVVKDFTICKDKDYDCQKNNPEGPELLAKILAPLLKMDVHKLGYKLSTPNTQYVVLKKNVDQQTVKKIQESKASHAVSFEVTTKRTYPNGATAGPEIGSTKVDDNTKSIIGVAGIEKLMDKELSGVNGIDIFEKSLTGKKIPNGEEQYTPAIDGKDIKTTLNADIQREMQEVIDRNMPVTGADYGFGVVEEIKTGKILAIGETNAAVAGTSDVSMKGSPAFTTAFDAGSTSKIMAAATMVDEGVSNVDQCYQMGSEYVIPGMKPDLNDGLITDAHSHPVMNLTLTGLVGQSYNTGTVMAGLPLTLEQRRKYLKTFNMGQKTNVNFPGESNGLLPKLDGTDGRTPHTILFGQGYSATALQLVNSYAIIANKGKDPVPTIIDSTRKPGEDWVPFEKPEGKQKLKKSTTKDIMRLMEASVVTGISNGAEIEGYRIGGKSGTSEMDYNIKTGEFDHNMMSFISVMPMDNPTYAVGVFYHDATKAKWGTVAAIPSAKELNQYLIQKFSIPISKPGDMLPPKTC